MAESSSLPFPLRETSRFLMKSSLSLDPPDRLEKWQDVGGNTPPLSQVAYSLGMVSLSKLSFRPNAQELGESIEKLGRFEQIPSQSLLRVAGILGVSGPIFSIVKALTNFR